MSQTQQSPESKPTSPSPSTPLTTPDQSPGHDSDIWASDDNDLSEHSEPHNHTRNPNDHELLSDLPALRRQHMTDGYREGLSVGKAKVMQSGFDAGYPIGVEIAMRVGTVLGVLEGWIAGMARLGVRKGEKGGEVEVKKMYDVAKEELVCTALLQGLGDEVVAGAKGIPEQVLVVIERWERRVLGRMVSKEGGERGE